MTTASSVISSARDFLQPGRLLGIGLVQVLQQLLGFGLKPAQQGEVPFGVPVCHGPFSVHIRYGGPAFQGRREDAASRPMARARCTASWRLCTPSFR